MTPLFQESNDRDIKGDSSHFNAADVLLSLREDYD